MKNKEFENSLRKILYKHAVDVSAAKLESIAEDIEADYFLCEKKSYVLNQENNCNLYIPDKFDRLMFKPVMASLGDEDFLNSDNYTYEKRVLVYIDMHPLPFMTVSEEDFLKNGQAYYEGDTIPGTSFRHRIIKEIPDKEKI